MEAIVGRTRGRLLAIARKIGARQDAEDTVQGAYHALLRHGAFREPVTVEAWLTTAVVRMAYRRKALAQRELQLAERLGRDRAVDPHAAAADRETIALVRHAVARLPAKYRDVLVLRHLEELSVAETGRLLNLPAATVKTRTRRGLAILKARVAPWAARAFFAGPWLLADSVRSTTGLGIVMNIKTAGTMAAVALAAATVGVGVGMGATSDTAAERREPVAREAPRVPAAIEAELAEWRGRAQRAERKLAAAPIPKSASPAPENAASSEFEARYAEHGRDLGVSPEALAAAKKAKAVMDEFRSSRGSPKLQKELNRAVAALTALGNEGFLALVAHLRATELPEGDYINLLGTTWSLGLETHLVRLTRDPQATIEQRRHALLGLSVTDTPDVRAHLLGELERVTDAKLIQGSAQALGWLHEDRAVPQLELLLYRRGKEKEQGGLLNALGSLGSKESRRVLTEYLEKEHSGYYLNWGVRALSWSDMDAGRAAAVKILAGPQAKKLKAHERRVLEGIAKR